MSKEKKVSAVNSEAPVVAAASSVLNAAPEKLSEVDKLSLDLARTKRQTVLAEAKTALANNEKAELEYKYLILQLYMKYGLTHEDAVSEAGDIIRGGAVQKTTESIMDIQELINLIHIRSWAVNSVSNPIFTRETVRELDGLLILLDKKIASILTGAEFKNYIGFGGLKQAIQDINKETKKPFHEARAIMSGIKVDK